MNQPIPIVNLNCLFEPKPQSCTAAECKCNPCECDPCICNCHDSSPAEPAQPTEADVQALKREKCIRFYKSLLINAACGLEFLCEKYTSWNLKDFSKSVGNNTDDFDQVLGKVYDRYGDIRTRWTPNPFLTLIFEFLTSALFNYISNCIFGPRSGLRGNIQSDVMSQLMKGVTTTAPATSDEVRFATSQPTVPATQPTQPMCAASIQSDILSQIRRGGNPAVPVCPSQPTVPLCPSQPTQLTCAAQIDMQAAMEQAMQAMRIQSLRDQGCKW